MKAKEIADRYEYINELLRVLNYEYLLFYYSIDDDASKAIDKRVKIEKEKKEVLNDILINEEIINLKDSINVYDEFKGRLNATVLMELESKFTQFNEEELHRKCHLKVYYSAKSTYFH
jgi:hypothetical protein